MHVAEREVRRFDDFAESHVIGVARASKDAAAIFDEEFPELVLAEPAVLELEGRAAPLPELLTPIATC
jgi:hypothetical protein